MPGVSKRGDGKKYRVWYYDETGRRKWAAGHKSKAASRTLAEKLEEQAKLVRSGVVDPGVKTRQKAAGVAIAHLVKEWEKTIVARNKGEKHARQQADVCARVLAGAGIKTVLDIDTDAVTAAVAALTTTGRGKAPRPASARTRNHALAATKAFVRWLDATGRIREYPKAWRQKGLDDRAVEAADRKRVRRALTPEEVARFLAAAEAAPDRHLYGRTRSKLHAVPVSGKARAFWYRVALGTGFRANELRSLTPASFDLDASPPTVTVEAGYSKNREVAVQTIAPWLAAVVRAWLAEHGTLPPLFDKMASWVGKDLKAAGIDPKAGGTVVDFHSLRHTFITALVASGASVKTCQSLARHSTPSLTIGRYAHVERGDMLRALAGAAQGVAQGVAHTNEPDGAP